MLKTVHQDWLGNVRGDLLAGMVVALALIPEAIAFSVIAGVDPRVGLYASFAIAVVIAFAGAYYLTRYLSASRLAAAVAAILFAFCPFIFARTAHIQLMFIGGLPWCMLAFHRLVDAPTVGRAVTLGVLLWATAMACAYYGIFAVLMVGLGTLLYAASRLAGLAQVHGLPLRVFDPHADLVDNTTWDLVEDIEQNEGSRTAPAEPQPAQPNQNRPPAQQQQQGAATP